MLSAIDIAMHWRW